MTSKATKTLKLKTVNVRDLIEDEENANQHPARSIEVLVASLERFGQVEPLVVRKGTNVVIGGNGRLVAMQRMEWETCVVHEYDGTKAECRALSIALNRSAELSDWNLDDLEESLGFLQESVNSLDLDVDMGSLGFDVDEMADLFPAEEPEVEDIEPQIDRAEELQKEWGTESGQLWEIGRHRLLCGDATNEEDVKRLLDGETPFLMVTDPPYGVNYENTKGAVTNDDRFDWSAAYALFGGDVAYVWHGERTSLDVGLNVRDSGFDIRGRVVWVKPALTMGRGHYHFQHEAAWYGVRKSKTSKWAGGHSQSTVWHLERENEIHPTVKPIECMSRPIRNHGGEGDHVYDPFLGSGTTMLAAEQLGRRCFGVEISPKYCAVILQRMKDAGCDCNLVARNKKRLSK